MRVGRRARRFAVASSFLLFTVCGSLFTGKAHALSPKDIYRKTAPSVVLILAYRADGSGTGGTGCVVDPAGRILTNAHVVVDEASHEPFEKIVVYFKPNRLTGDPEQDLENPVEASVVRHDEKMDLALLTLRKKPTLPAGPLSLADPGQVEPGDFVVAIGHPEQGGLWTITTGIISTIVAHLEGVRGKTAFQTDASINRGNSGGPLLDEDGRVIGINTLIVREASDGGVITDVNFAIRSDVVKSWIDRQGIDVAYNWYTPPVGPDGVATRRIKAAPMGARIIGARTPFSFDALLGAKRTSLSLEK